MNATASAVLAALKRRRILVVEDEYMIAEDLVGALAGVGAETVGPAPRVAQALQLVATESRIDGAVLDVMLYNEAVWPVADMLLARGVPLLLATGYDARRIPQAYAHLPRCEKLASGREVTHALAKVLADAAPA